MFDDAVIDKRSALPRHAQIEALFRSLIASGRLAPGERIPTEVEIADALRVSRMTVNKAILSLTREGLFRRERGLGTFVTQPEIAMRQLLIVIPISDATAWDGQDSYYSPLARAMQQEAETRSYRVSTAYLARGSYLSLRSKGPVDGWLLISPDANRLADLRELRRAGEKFIVAGAHWPEFPDVPMVDSDNIAGAQTAISYLTDLGHTNIAMVYAGPEASNTADRRTGYRLALRDAGISFREEWEIQADAAESLGSGGTALRELLALPEEERPTAIFAAGYYLALETLNLAHTLGFAVPAELSVVGYDDPYAAQLAYPPLTTLRQPLPEMGRQAATLLDLLLRGEKPESLRVSCAPELQVRASAGPPGLRSLS